MIDFVGVNYDVEQFIINSGSEDALTGNNIAFDNLTPFPYSSNLFYDQIPFEWLYTDETNPQVIVHVNDLPAVCTGLECDFAYIAP